MARALSWTASSLRAQGDDIPDQTVDENSREGRTNEV